MVLDTHKKRRAIPYELSMMRDAASNSRVAATEAVRMEGAMNQARSAVKGVDTSIPGMAGKPSYNANTVYDLPVTQSATEASAQPTGPTTSLTGQLEAAIEAQGGPAPTTRTTGRGAELLARNEAEVAKRVAKRRELEVQAMTEEPVARGILLRQIAQINRELQQLEAEKVQISKGSPYQPKAARVSTTGGKTAAIQPPVEDATFTPPPSGGAKVQPAVQGGASFDELVGKILKREGGYQNNPDDNGNWTGGKKGVGQNKGTKFGISAASYPDLDIKNLTREQAVAIYKRDYWDAIGADQLPESLRDTAFDAAVNQGAQTAKRWLAQSGGNPETFNMYRRQRYDAVAQQPGQAQFKASWDARLSEVSAATTPGEAIMQGTGEPGLNTDMYVQDPEALSLDQQNLTWMYSNVENRLQVLQGMADAMDPFEYMNAVQGLQSQALQINTALAVTYAYQGLQMAQSGQVDLLQQSMRALAGPGYSIKPYQGGFYELYIDGRPTNDGIMPYDAFVQRVRGLIDPAYADSIAAANAQASAKIAEIEAQTRGDIAIEGVKGRNAINTAAVTQGLGLQRDIAVEREKANIAKEAGLQPTKESTPDGNPIFSDPRTGKSYVLVLQTEKVRGKTVSTYVWEETLSP